MSLIHTVGQKQTLKPISAIKRGLFSAEEHLEIQTHFLEKRDKDSRNVMSRLSFFYGAETSRATVTITMRILTLATAV